MASSGYDFFWKGVIVATFVLFFSIIFYDLLTWIVFEQCELSKFPLIYGVDGCNFFVNRSINLKFNLGSVVISAIGSKMMFYASMNDNELLFFKKLATKSELQLFDKVNDYTTESSINFTLHNLVENTFVPDGSNVSFKIRICPNIESIERFIQLYNVSNYNISPELLVPSLWTLLQLNPEPLMLTILRPPHWPVPKYYGSCGRLAVFEHCGTRLTDLANAPYAQRLNISLQVITAALKFTFHHPDFAIYLTDLSPDNIVVNGDGIVKFVDFENVILVEKTNKVNDELKWLRNHSSVHYDCNDCITYSSDDICSHQFSDHNIYAVCKEIFSPSSLFPDGFLHSPPDGFQQSDVLSQLIQDCIEPTGKQSRFQIIFELSRLLS